MENCPSSSNPPPGGTAFANEDQYAGYSCSNLTTVSQTQSCHGYGTGTENTCRWRNPQPGTPSCSHQHDRENYAEYQHPRKKKKEIIVEESYPLSRDRSHTKTANNCHVRTPIVTTSDTRRDYIAKDQPQRNHYQRNREEYVQPKHTKNYESHCASNDHAIRNQSYICYPTPYEPDHNYPPTPRSPSCQPPRETYTPSSHKFSRPPSERVRSNRPHSSAMRSSGKRHRCDQNIRPAKNACPRASTETVADCPSTGCRRKNAPTTDVDAQNALRTLCEHCNANSPTHNNKTCPVCNICQLLRMLPQAQGSGSCMPIQYPNRRMAGNNTKRKCVPAGARNMNPRPESKGSVTYNPKSPRTNNWRSKSKSRFSQGGTGAKQGDNRIRGGAKSLQKPKGGVATNRYKAMQYKMKSCLVVVRSDETVSELTDRGDSEDDMPRCSKDRRVPFFRNALARANFVKQHQQECYRWSFLKPHYSQANTHNPTTLRPSATFVVPSEYELLKQFKSCAANDLDWSNVEQRDHTDGECPHHYNLQQNHLHFSGHNGHPMGCNSGWNWRKFLPYSNYFRSHWPCSYRKPTQLPMNAGFSTA